MTTIHLTDAQRDTFAATGLTTYPATKLTHRDPLPAPGQWVVELEQVKGDHHATAG